MSARSRGRVLATVATLAVVAVVVAAVFIMESPVRQRQRRLDERRVQDLGSVQAALEVYRNRHNRLPPSLKVLVQEPGLWVSVRDPETHSLYRYAAAGDRNFTLCARFALDSVVDRRGQRPASAPDQWAHGAGEHCFERSIPVDSSRIAKP